MKRFTILSCMLTVCGATSLAVGRSPLPIDRPTPPPCAADGTCYPKTGEWGYYPARWRMWPGAELVPTPLPAAPPPPEARVSPELGHSETPPAELEDAAAPPSAPKREVPPTAPPEAGEAAPERGEPSLPEVPLPEDETPPLGPTSDADPPPSPPLSMSSRSRGASDGHAAAPVGEHHRSPAPRVTTNDPPPSPPWAHSAAL
jgi:hypothetical protein